MNTHKKFFSTKTLRLRYVIVLIPLIIGITFLRGFNLIANARVSTAPNSPTLVTLVEQDFNGATNDVLNSGWYAENIATPGIIDATLGTSGKDSSAYHTPAINGDRAFGFYKTSDKNSNQNSFIRFTFTTTMPVEAISGTFDFESSYTFWDASKPRQIGFSQDSLGTNGFAYSLNGNPLVEILNGQDIDLITNANITKDFRMNWFSDAEMDNFSLSIRDIPFTLSGLNLEVCDTLELFWNSTEPVNLYEDMQVNIDNFKLSGTQLAGTSPDLVQVDDDWTGLANCSIVTVNEIEYRIGVDAFSSIQAGIDVVASNGTVNINPGVYTENLTITKPLTILGDGLPALDAGGNTAIGCTATGDLIVKGLEIKNSSTIFELNGCNLTAYANNITTYTTPYVSTDEIVDLGHNWWGSPAPSGLTGSDQDHRLGAPIISWADGPAGDVSLSNASLDSTNNEGLAVIINHGRGDSSAPFGDKGKSNGDRICSDYYDVFLVDDNTGEYTVKIILDDTPECRTDTSSALLKNGLFLYDRSGQEWVRVPSTSHDSESVFAVVTAEVLDGTPFVADSADNDVFLPLITK